MSSTTDRYFAEERQSKIHRLKGQLRNRIVDLNALEESGRYAVKMMEILDHQIKSKKKPFRPSKKQS